MPDNQHLLEVVLCSDHDFQLFGDLRFNPNHEIHIDVMTGQIVYNSAQNTRHALNNAFAVGLALTTSVYVGYMYKQFTVVDSQ